MELDGIEVICHKTSKCFSSLVAFAYHVPFGKSGSCKKANNAFTLYNDMAFCKSKKELPEYFYCT